MGIYKDNFGKLLSGAGILILENYHKKNGDIIDSIVVVRNRYTGKYMDFGGSYESKHKNLQETAHHELREESINLYNISPKYFKTFFDIPACDNIFYRVYVIKINGSQRKLFYNNRKIIYGNKKSPKCWKETDDISHIPIDNIQFDILNNNSKFSIFDINDRKIKLHSRLKKALYYGQKIIKEYVHHTALIDKYNKHKSSDFTNNTYSFIKK
jgi:hypothetical protein